MATKTVGTVGCINGLDGGVQVSVSKDSHTMGFVRNGGTTIKAMVAGSGIVSILVSDSSLADDHVLEIVSVKVEAINVGTEDHGNPRLGVQHSVISSVDHLTEGEVVSHVRYLDRGFSYVRSMRG